MLLIVFGLLLLVTLALAVLPVPRVCHWLLTGLTRLLQGSLLGLLGMCGTFFVQPEAAPDWLQPEVHSYLAGRAVRSRNLVLSYTGLLDVQA